MKCDMSDNTCQNNNNNNSNNNKDAVITEIIQYDENRIK